MAEDDRGVGHVFLCYAREDSHMVDLLQRKLEDADIPVWRDKASIWPGEDWRAAIRHAIRDQALAFIVCFSRQSLSRDLSYQNEELTLAIEQLRLRRPERPWLIPVRFDACDVPDYDLGGGRSLAWIQRADLFGQSAEGEAALLVRSVRRILGIDFGASPDSGKPPGEQPRYLSEAEVAAAGQGRPTTSARQVAGSPAGAVIASRPLPGHIRASLDSPSPNVRVGAVHDLGTLLAGADPGLALAARQALEQIADADNPAVATVSRRYLNAAQSHRDESYIARPPPVSGVVSSSQLLVVTESLRGQSLRIWDAVSGARKAKMKGHCGIAGGYDAAAFSPDGSLLATGFNETARIWDVATGAALATPIGHQNVVCRVRFSPDGALLATVGCYEPTVRIWDSSTGAARATLVGSAGPGPDVAFSPDRTLLAAAAETAQVWDIATGAVRATLQGPANSIMAVAFSPDGTLIATGSVDETARIWEAATGAVRASLIGHQGPVRRVAFSPDSALLATIDDRATLRIWDAAAGASRVTRTGPIWGAALAPYGKLKAFTYEATSIVATNKYESDGMAFSPDGALLATFGDGNVVRIWDAATGAHRGILKNYTGFVRAVVFIAGNL